MDDAIGKLLQKLKDEKLEDNTLIFFVSDNGGPTMQGTTINGSINTPLRGSKRTTLEGGIRVPFFVRWPAKLPAGKVYDQPVIQLDVLPTVLAAAGVRAQPAWKLDGVNLLPFLAGDDKRAPHHTLCWRFGRQMAIRQGDWKLVRYDANADGMPGVATVARLYNLASDIGETTDLAVQRPEKTRELQAAWDAWNADNVA